MLQWVILDDSSPDFRYSGPWITSLGVSKIPSPFQNTYHATVTSASLTFSFEGTAFNVYGSGQSLSTIDPPTQQTDPANGQLECYVDGASVSMETSVPSPKILSSELWCGQGGMTAGHHTVEILTKLSIQEMQMLYLDYAIVLPLSSVSLDNKATIFGYDNTVVQYGPGWLSPGTTNQSKTSLRLDFNGVGISMYGEGKSTSPLTIHNTSSGSYSIDGAQPRTFTLSVESGPQKLFQISQLPLGNHSVEVTYTPTSDPPVPPPAFKVQSFVVDAGSHKSSVTLSLIITFPILGALFIGIVVWLLQRRLRKRSAPASFMVGEEADWTCVQVEPFNLSESHIASGRPGKTLRDSALPHIAQDTSGHQRAQMIHLGMHVERSEENPLTTVDRQFAHIPPVQAIAVTLSEQETEAPPEYSSGRF